jgi:hypothetical protein
MIIITRVDPTAAPEVCGRRRPSPSLPASAVFEIVLLVLYRSILDQESILSILATVWVACLQLRPLVCHPKWLFWHLPDYFSRWVPLIIFPPFPNTDKRAIGIGVKSHTQQQ